MIFFSIISQVRFYSTCFTSGQEGILREFVGNVGAGSTVETLYVRAHEFFLVSGERTPDAFDKSENQSQKILVLF